jgi:GNAT superfamily N-acetyltransferase
MRVERARADEEPGASLVAAMVAEIDELYSDTPGNLSSYGVSADEMAPPHGAFVLIGDDEGPLACGGIKRLTPEIGEIKRMYVVPRARSRGVGTRLLAELERAARELGYSTVRLDTGSRQPAAKLVYERAGYAEIDDYNGNPYAAHWYERSLAGEA